MLCCCSARHSSRRVGRGSGARRPYLADPTRTSNDSPGRAGRCTCLSWSPCDLERYGSETRHARLRPMPRRPELLHSRERVELPALDDLVDDAVLLGLVRGQDLVALDVGADLLHGP